MRSDNASGVPGVCWDTGRGKWEARVKKDGRTTAKRFEVLTEAALWVSEKRLELFGEFAPENRKGIIEVVPEPGPDASNEPLNEPFQLQLFG